MPASSETITSRDFQRLRVLIYEKIGIKLGDDKRTMLEVRIKRRLRELGHASYNEYCDYLFSHTGQIEELEHLFNVVTTNKTDFFREPRHFDFLREQALPEFEARVLGRPFLIWSAACSSGEEPYTMAIVLSEYAAQHPGFRFRIHATDISTTVLEKAQSGIYTSEIIAPVEEPLKRRYFLRSRDRGSDRVRVVPELRQAVDFRRLNFMDEDYGMMEKVDAIFCRNVLIYFDRPTQQKILSRLCRYLHPGCYLFVGHAEALHDLRLPVTPVAPALYRRVDAGV
ncbi:CheR family methyltransferase [Telmatobacter bradus]|uniref:CheR family methyltransferase n=1 Tax=Telmatobacter bradus TaxID=474953 RepID=UPI003B437066